MKRIILAAVAGLAAVAVMAVAAAPSSAATSQACLAKSHNGERVFCGASVAASHPTVARVRMGNHSVGRGRLTCTKGNKSIRATFLLGPGAVKQAGIPHGYNCVLSVRANSRTVARARVTLV